MVLRNPFNRRRGDDDGGDTVTIDGIVYDVNPDTGFAVGSFADIEARAAAGESRDELIAAALEAPGINQAGAERVADGALQSVGRGNEVAPAGGAAGTFGEFGGLTDDDDEVVASEGDFTEVSGEEGAELERLVQAGNAEGVSEWLINHWPNVEASPGTLARAKELLAASEGGGLTADAIRVIEETQAEEALERPAPEAPDPDEVIEERETEESQQTLLQFARDELERTGVVPSSAELAAKGRELALPNIPDAIRGVESILSGEVEDEPEEGEVDLTGRFQTQLPEWALAQIASITGGPVTPDLERRIVEQWNFQHGGEFEAIDEIAPFLETFSQDNQTIIQSAVMDELPRQGWLVDVPNQRPVAVSAALAENLRDNYGYDPGGITRLVRFAAMDGDSRVLPYDDPADNSLILASAMAGLGFADDLSRFEEEERAREARETELRRRAIESGNIRAIEAFERRGPLALTQERVARELSPEGRFGREVGLPSTAGRGLVQIAKQRIRLGLERYQNIGLAVIHAVDDELAERVADTGGDIDKLTYEDELILRNVINRTNGAVPEGWLDLLKGDPLSPLFNAAGRGAGGGGGAGPVRRLIDPVQAKQQFSDLYSALLLTDPSPDLENQFVQDLQKALDDAEEGMNFDASARILDFVRGTTRYQELYGNKPEGQGEEEYLSQFLGTAQNLLGTETPPPEAVAAGLRTGETQTTVGQIAAEQLAKPEQFRNSRFFGRLAEAANVFKAGT